MSSWRFETLKVMQNSSFQLGSLGLLKSIFTVSALVISFFNSVISSVVLCSDLKLVLGVLLF